MDLFQLAASLLSDDTPPMLLSAWGFGSYATTPDEAQDVDLLLVFANGSINHIESIKPYCVRLRDAFLTKTGKYLHLERLTEKECTDVNFVTVASAVQVWSRRSEA